VQEGMVLEWKGMSSQKMGVHRKGQSSPGNIKSCKVGCQRWCATGWLLKAGVKVLAHSGVHLLSQWGSSSLGRQVGSLRQ
jgi:hypothetical protein